MYQRQFRHNPPKSFIREVLSLASFEYITQTLLQKCLESLQSYSTTGGLFVIDIDL